MKDLLYRTFGLTAAGTTIRTEVVAGLVTFLTLSYIVFVQPALLSHPACGMDRGAVMFATCVASGLACWLMAWWANYPVALAPAMGHNFFFVFTVCAGLGFSWQQALAANLIAGATFLLLSGSGLREAVMRALPEPLRYAISVGIGLMIALVGMQWGGLIVDHPVVLVQLGDLGQPVALLTLFGLAVTSLALARGWPAAMLLGIVASTLVGLAFGEIGQGPALVSYHGLASLPPTPAATALQLDFAGLFARPLADWVAVLLVFLVLDLFDTVGTLTGVADRAGLLEGGRLPRARGALAADAAGTTVGALLGTSTVTSYVESAAGVASGGRTGLVAVVVGACLVACLWFSPLVEMVGGGVVVAGAGGEQTYYPVLAPVLILIGAMMMTSVRRIDWEQSREAIPAFLTIVVMQLSVSITDGLAFGLISWSLLHLSGERRASLGVHALAALLLGRYVFL